ncbi:MAG: glyceraldehyde 3-phosphate dehydrogenase NAD-binding domain-containing protein [Pseudomonadota bacterium]
MRILINGFGRIGRTLLRQLLRDPQHADVEIAAINDVAALDICAYLFQYDSVFGPYPGRVETGPQMLTIDGQPIPFTQSADLTVFDLSGIDVVLECTGAAGTRAVAERGLKAGAATVLISGPSEAADVTVVRGANEEAMGQARIVSNASCTTNAIAPLLRCVDARFGLQHGHITTIHCYTGSQPLVDSPRDSFARSRAGAISMVPTTTSAARQLTRILPAMEGRVSVSAVRVPAISVSAIDAVLQLTKPVELAALWDALKATGVIGLTEEPLVSVDLRGRPDSLVVAVPETERLGAQQLRLLGWYDNEWGFSARMIDIARQMAARAG